jgi:ABC-type spermidine/putrescine transport system permease subunit II
VLSALPAFLIGSLAAYGLGRFGVSEVLSFMISMPLLIFAWY